MTLPEPGDNPLQNKQDKISNFGQGTVFVLGAGFTKSLLPDAPLMIDDYGGRDLLKAFKGPAFDEARKLLRLELKASKGKINVERLMTRLQGRMPYDLKHGTAQELDLLLFKINRRFRDRIASATTSGQVHDNELRNFARHCIDHSVHCITFNYDDLLDKALWEVNPSHGYGTTWNPDTGYGFPCRVAVEDVVPVRAARSPSSMQLLKLHGSINWRIRLGHPKPYGPDAVRHHENWYRPIWYVIGPPQNSPEDVEVLLDPESFFVLPVLTKTELVEMPILRFLWSKAYDVLRSAQQVVFMGYSLPLTDIAAGFLFREGLEHLDRKRIRIVDFATNEKGRKQKLPTLLQAYRNVFPTIPKNQFEFSGAKDWIFNNLTQWLYDSKGIPVAFIYGMHVVSRQGKFIGSFIDGPIIWGKTQDGKSVYIGNMEEGRLLFRDDMKAEPKYQAIQPPTIPGIPTRIADPVKPISLRAGYRDLDLDNAC